jgi:hypothetical protein
VRKGLAEGILWVVPKGDRHFYGICGSRFSEHLPQRMTMAPHKAARAVTQPQISAVIFHSRAIASFTIWMIVHDRPA